MRCTRARSTFVERELGRIGPHAEAALQAHLVRCDACAAWSATERRLTADLTSLRSVPPFEIDVTARVAANLSGLRPAREEVSTRQLGWAVTAAVASGAALFAGLWALLPGLARTAADSRALFASLGDAASSVADAMLTLAMTGIGLLGDLLASLAVASASLEPLVPAAIAIAALGSTMMGTTVFVVVRRDFKKANWIREEG